MIFLSLLSIIFLVFIINYIYINSKTDNQEEEQEEKKYDFTNDIKYIEENISSMDSSVFFSKIRSILIIKFKEDFDKDFSLYTLEDLKNYKPTDLEYKYYSFILFVYNKQYINYSEAIDRRKIYLWEAKKIVNNKI